MKIPRNVLKIPYHAWLVATISMEMKWFLAVVPMASAGHQDQASEGYRVGGSRGNEGRVTANGVAATANGVNQGWSSRRKKIYPGCW